MNGLGSRALAVVGNPEEINCWSNIPYFFLSAGKRAGFLQTSFALDTTRLRLPRMVWNICAPLRQERPGGFQYTAECLNLLMEMAADQRASANVTEVISHFQLFPPFEMNSRENLRFAHYIDFPLPCLFDEYGIAKTIGKRTAARALAREREQYAAADAIICMSDWAKRQVVERCGTPATKVHVVLPGANLPESLFSGGEREDPPLEVPDGRHVPLRIAFVGKVPERKGLPRLVQATRILVSRGFKACLKVIGPSSNSFPNDPFVEHLGFIDKTSGAQRFVAELRSCHIGALLSHQEAFGIAALEYLRCGLPSLLTRVGGLQDSVPGDCSILLPPDCSSTDVADCLESLLRQPEYFLSLSRQARAKARQASWDRTVQDFKRIWKDAVRK